MKRITKPSILPTLNGNLIKRANLLRFIREFVEATNMPEGYYMEFGVLNGEGMVDAYRQLRGVATHFFGFDSFEGLPDLASEDDAARSYSPHFHPGNFKSLGGAEAVRQTVTSLCRMHEDELTLIPGFYSEVLPGLDKRAFRAKGVPLCVYVDCDLYSSTRDVLKFISDLVVTGTWILFDDFWFYRGSPFYGEQKAIREWLDENKRVGLSDYCNFDGFGRAFIVHEK